MKYKFSLIQDASGIFSNIYKLAFLGPILILLYGSSNINYFWIIASQGLLLGFATLMIGFFIGFLFGIPKHVTKNIAGTYTSNTNLEDISDWLTKILVGLGLAQLTYIPGKLEETVNYLSQHMYQIPQSILLSILIYFFFYGFFAGYLITRIYLSKAFAKTEDHLQSLNKATEEAERYTNQTIKTESVLKPRDAEIDKKVQHLITEIISQSKDVEESGGDISSEQYFKQGKIMVMNQNYQFAKDFFIKSYQKDGNYKAGSNAALVLGKYLNQYNEAEEILAELVKKQPDEPLGWYNRACNFARMNKIEDAVINLKKALELGKQFFYDEAKRDPAFIPIKDDPSFKETIPDYNQ